MRSTARPPIFIRRNCWGIAYTKEANINLVYVGRDISYMLLATNDAERTQFAATLDESLKALRANADKAKPLFHTERGKEKFAEFERKLSEYEALIPDLKQQVSALGFQEDGEVIQYFFDTIRTKSNEVDQLMTELSELKTQNAQAADDLTNEIYRTSRLEMIALVIGGGVLGVLLGLLIARSITRPLKTAVEVAETVAAGDLSSRIEVKSSDELG